MNGTNEAINKYISDALESLSKCNSILCMEYIDNECKASEKLNDILNEKILELRKALLDFNE